MSNEQPINLTRAELKAFAVEIAQMAASVAASTVLGQVADAIEGPLTVSPDAPPAAIAGAQSLAKNFATTLRAEAAKISENGIPLAAAAFEEMIDKKL